MGYICSAITDFIVTFADDADIVNLHNWSMGSFSGISWENAGVITVSVILTSLGVFFCSKPLSAYQLGEDYAKNMGVNVPVFRAVLILLSSILSACVTAFAGTGVFVGNRRSSLSPAYDEYGEADSDHSGMFSRRIGFLSVL